MSRTYLTRDGFEKLRKELEYLQTVKRRQITNDIAHARSLGDLKENAEYHAAKEAQGLNEKKISELDAKLSVAEIIDNMDIASDEIRIGARAELLDIKTKEKVEFTLVSSEESNPSTGMISVVSPIGKALLGHKVGDIVEIKVPLGILQYKVVKISR